jgi:iron complex outermembrane recepter protein
LIFNIGFRWAIVTRSLGARAISYDIATFYNVYDDLRTVVYGPAERDPVYGTFVYPGTFVNAQLANSYGVELATNYSVSEHWRLSANYTFLKVLLWNPDQSTNGNSPQHQVYLKSSWDLSENVDFDLMLRYVDCIPVMDVPSYITMDLRLAWRPRKNLELALVGQNLLQQYHYEFGQTTEFGPTSENPGHEVSEVPRGVYGTATWRY